MCGVNGLIAVVQEMERAKRGVAILLNDVWHSAVIDFECVSSRILWIKLKFSRVKVCVVVGYGPSEGDGGERDRFWNDMDRILDRVGNRLDENRYNWCFRSSRREYNGRRVI